MVSSKAGALGSKWKVPEGERVCTFGGGRHLTGLLWNQGPVLGAVG